MFTARQSVEKQAALLFEVDVVGLEACLFVLIHMGSLVVQVIQLAVDAATAQFGSVKGQTRNRLRCESLRYAVLEAAMEVGTATKSLCSQLARKSGEVSSEDVKNFLQRWVIVQAASSGVWDSNRGASCGCEHCNPSLAALCPSQGSEDDRSSSEAVEDWRGMTSPANYPRSYQSWLTTLLCNPNSATTHGSHTFQQGGSPSKPINTRPMSSFFMDIMSQVHRFSTDPDFQLAGII